MVKVLLEPIFPLELEVRNLDSDITIPIVGGGITTLSKDVVSYYEFRFRLQRFEPVYDNKGNIHSMPVFELYSIKNYDEDEYLVKKMLDDE